MNYLKYLKKAVLNMPAFLFPSLCLNIKQTYHFGDFVLQIFTTTSCPIQFPIKDFKVVHDSANKVIQLKD